MHASLYSYIMSFVFVTISIYKIHRSHVIFLLRKSRYFQFPRFYVIQFSNLHNFIIHDLQLVIRKTNTNSSENLIRMRNYMLLYKPFSQKKKKKTINVIVILFEPQTEARKWYFIWFFTPPNDNFSYSSRKWRKRKSTD